MDRVRQCGSTTVSDGGVTVGVATMPDGSTHAGYGGVSTCGSVWACPQCAAVIAKRRADELAQVMHAVHRAGGSAHMLTLTLQHNQHDRLGWNREQRRRHTALVERRRDRDQCRGLGDDVDEDQALAEARECSELEAVRGCWDALGDAWARATSGGTWVKDQERHGGLLGWVRVVETTRGRNGWHVHIHALLCFAEDVDEADVYPIAARMFSRWRKALNDAGFDASGDLGADGKIPGWDLRRAQLHDNAISSYLTKLSMEVAASHTKEGRRPGGRTPMQLLADAVETYEVGAVGAWREWEAASEGRRQMTWSAGKRNLRELAQLGEEQTDEEIAAEELPADDSLGLPPDTWGWIRSGEHEDTVLVIGEDEGIAGICRWLDDHGQVWSLSTAAELRGRDPAGRPRRRPSDRPPRWTDEAHADP